MIVSAWRIVKRKYAQGAFSGQGAKRYGGRWNNPGIAMVYTAQSQSLAALEIAVHLDSSELLETYVAFEVRIEKALITRIDVSELPRNWRAYPPPMKTRQLGDAWTVSGASAVLQVPSATIPAESNFLLNPRHIDFAKLHIGKPRPFQFDPRLAEKT